MKIRRPTRSNQPENVRVTDKKNIHFSEFQQQLVEKLPETKLVLAYHLLLELVGKEVAPQLSNDEVVSLISNSIKILILTLWRGEVADMIGRAYNTV